MALGQTITVVNKSGKIVSSSKHLVNVFKEAKSAYRERKAEIRALRDSDVAEKNARRAIKDLSIDDDGVSRTSSHRSHKSDRRKRRSRERPPIERGYSDSFFTNDEPRPSRTQRRSNLRNEYSPNGEIQRNELVRRHTDGYDRRQQRPKTSRSASMSDIDMDLAYGELPPPLPIRRRDDEVELRGQMSKLQQLLDEANCVQHSVVATIENLQKNPDSLAAVALTLGEISALASKMAPGVLMSMKGAFPAAIALLLSPEFLIAAGVGVGVTVIMLGGYKIIKRIKKRNADKAIEDGEETESAGEFDELREINSDLSHIEMWRRGIAEAEASSLGTSVDGEFITPGATKYLVAEGVIREDDLKSTKSRKSSKSKKGKDHKSEKSSSSRTRDKKDRNKEPSGLRMLFKTGSNKKAVKEPMLV
ncbi:hypothetical protein MBLNU459_g8456t1 [Dothideomycetes sp. NU459]